MFTVEQIKQAHSKVKSGADFPAYIRELKQLGVAHYVNFVNDGHTDYFGSNNYQTSGPAKYPALQVADQADAEKFKAGLKAHQQGKSGYLTFCNQCAVMGIEKWIVNISAMTCTYYDKAGNEILVETIPA